MAVIINITCAVKLGSCCSTADSKAATKPGGGGSESRRWADAREDRDQMSRDRDWAG